MNLRIYHGVMIQSDIITPPRSERIETSRPIQLDGFQILRSGEVPKIQYSRREVAEYFPRFN